MRPAGLGHARFHADCAPLEIEGEPPRSVLRDPVVIDARGCDARNDRYEMGWNGHRRQPLNGPFVGHPVHRDLAVRPTLLCGPLDRVVAVVDVVPEGLPLTARFIATANVLIHEDVAAPG